MLRIVAYSNEEVFYATRRLVKRHRTVTEKECSVLSLSLHLVVWRPLWGWTSEERLLKKQVVWVLAHSLPVVLPEGLPWKQGVWQALGGSATAAGTSFLTGWWRHHCHTMHNNNNNNWRKKMWSDNVNCCVAQMFISKLVKHSGTFPTAFGDHIAECLCLPRLAVFPGDNKLINNSLNTITPLWRGNSCACVCMGMYCSIGVRWCMESQINNSNPVRLLYMIHWLWMIQGTSMSTTSVPQTQRCDSSEAGNHGPMCHLPQ